MNKGELRYQFSVERDNPTTTYCHILRMVPPGCSVLELGCATGYLSKELQVEGCRVTGIEYDAAAAEQARQFCDRVIVGDLETEEVWSGLEQSYDAIVAADVLEHMFDTAAFLRRVHDNLAPDGVFVISFPNIGHLLARRALLWGSFSYRELGIFDRTHIRWFTIDSFEAAASKAGFRIVRRAYVPNQNNFGDWTFFLLRPLYYPKQLRRFMVHVVERRLANYFPGCFAYQCVFALQKAEYA